MESTSLEILQQRLKDQQLIIKDLKQEIAAKEMKEQRQIIKDLKQEIAAKEKQRLDFEQDFKRFKASDNHFFIKFFILIIAIGLLGQLTK